MPKKTIEAELAASAVKDLQRRERKTAKALLLSEARSLAGYRKPIQYATDSVIASHARGQSALSQVRRQMPVLQSHLQEEIRRSHLDARAAGRRRLEEEVARPLHAAAISAAEDDAFADLVASSLASAWGSTGLSLLSGNAVTVTAKDLDQLTELLDGRVRRAAATETARAFNREREALLPGALGLAGSAGGNRFDLGVPAAGAFKVWSAILDRATCPRCFAVDGEIIELHKSFSAGAPPLHPHCRCVVEFIVVQKPERLEDIAIDYDLFKQEVRDIILEGRAESQRHALSFASDSLGAKRSPTTLTRRFAGEPYATTKTPPAAPPAPVAPTAPLTRRPDVGRLPNGEEVRFVPHFRGAGRVTVMVDAQALDRAWQLDKGFYIAPGEEGIPGRRAGIAQFLGTGVPIQASQVSINKDGRAAFVDGRHRFATLRDKGIDRVAITIPKADLKRLPSEFKATRLAETASGPRRIEGTARIHGSAANPREVWRPNPPGTPPRTMAEALGLLKEVGVDHDPEHIHFVVAKRPLPEGTHASYMGLQIGSKHGPERLSIDPSKISIDLSRIVSRDGNFISHVAPSVFLSDEAIVSVLGHEIYETEALRREFEANGGRLNAKVLHSLVNAERGSIHVEAWDEGDRLTRELRRIRAGAGP